MTTKKIKMPHRKAGDENESLLFTTDKPIVMADDNGVKISTVELLRTGIIRDRGLEITRKMIEDYVLSVEEKVVGSELRVTVGHKRDNGGDDPAAGWFRRVWAEQNGTQTRMMGEIVWTELGIHNLEKKLFKFVSVELAMRYPHAQRDGIVASNVFLGAALTNTPALKNQQPIALSEGEARLIKLTSMFKKYIEDLKAREKVTKADVAFARMLLTDVDEADKATGETDVADLEKKAADKEAEEKKTAEEKAKVAEAAAAALNDKGNKTVSLTEHEALKAKHEKLAEEFEAKELTESFDTIVLSDKRSTGLTADSKEATLALMKSLTSDQRKEFLSIIGKVRHVDLTVHGKDATGSVDMTGDKQEQIVALAEKKFKDAKEADKILSMADAQKQAMAELNGKK